VTPDLRAPLLRDRVFTSTHEGKLSVCLSVISHSTGRIVTSIVSKLYQYIP